MAAEIHQLPRFEGERARKLPSGTVTVTEALAILAGRAGEWRDFIDDELQNGDTFINAESERDHRVIDGEALQVMGEDLARIAIHLQNLSELLDDEREAQ